jgi:hypothetical protein
MWPFNGQHARFWGFTFFGIAMALLVLGLIPGWGVTADISVVGIAVLSIWFLCWLAWALATGRVGLVHGEPTARRRRRLERRAAAQAQADALMQQQRLEAALQHGPYRSESSARAAAEKAERRHLD